MAVLKEVDPEPTDETEDEDPESSPSLYLETEGDRLRRIEAAAKEALAFLEGRRPGFASTYALEILRAALTPQVERRKAVRAPQKRPTTSKPRKKR